MPLRQLFEEVIKHYDCTVLEGHRSSDRQDELCRIGRSKLRFPNSKHNSLPSLAVDVAPCNKYGGIDWFNKEQFYHFAGFVLGVASQMRIDIRSGLDWDGDKDLNDQTFIDGPHFELDIKK